MLAPARMNRKVTITIILAVAASLVAGALLIAKKHSHPAVLVTLRVVVIPKEQSDFVAAQANSARFKYLVGKQAGLKPGLAQKLTAKTAPDSSLVDAQVGVLTKDEARRYVEAFLDTLQAQCGTQAQLTLANQSIR